MPKIRFSFTNFRDRIRAAVNVKVENILFFSALTLLIFIAIMIRLTPILRPPILIKEFDPWMQYYNAKYISEHSLYEYFHWKDTKSWYPEGRQRAALRPGLPFTAVVFYKILNFIGIPITLYEVCFYFPAFLGGMTVLVAYFLGKEVYNRSCGLFTAFFLAFNPGHMQRTVAGFFDNETIGILSILMVFLFFLKTIRTGKFSYSIIGGAFLGYLSLSWGGYQFAFYILPIVVGLMILLNKYDENVLIAYSGIQGTGFLIYSLYFSYNRDGFFKDMSSAGVFLFTIVLIGYHFLYSKRKEYPRFYNTFLNSIKWGAIPGFLIVAIIIWVKPELIPLGLNSRLESILTPLVRDKMHLVASVAEHMPSAWSVFYYNNLIPLMLLPLGIFFCFKRLNYADILMMVFILTIFYFTGSMVRIILLFGPAASLVGAFGLVNVLKIFGSFTGEKKIGPIRKRRRQIKKSVGNSEVFAVYFLVGFLCIAQVLHATDISLNQLSYGQMVIGEDFHDWEESLTWMKNNLDGTDVVVSWWDYGYWLTPVGNVTSVNDNGTENGKKIGLVGMAFMQTNEIYSAEVLRELEADYVLVYFGFLLTGFGGDEGKWPWMLRICNDHYEEFKKDDLEKDNWATDSVFDEEDYINETSGLYNEAWFESQLVRLMFAEEETIPSGIDPNEQYPRWYYASQINGNTANGISARETDDGDEWSDFIPEDGAYDFKVFKKAYFSQHGLVKIYKVDYTALDSKFTIENPKVFDMGAAAFNLKNTGIKDLTINSVAVNGIYYNFTIGAATNHLKPGEQAAVWVDVEEDYQINDAVNISVTAESTALEGTIYSFTERTNTFFVSKPEQGDIKINRENSKVVYNGTTTSVDLEIENTGNKIENLDNFYVDTEQNTFDSDKTQYLSGSSVLNPGTKCLVRLNNAPADFYTTTGIKGHLIGVKTSSGVKEEVLFSYNTEGHKLSILSEERNVPPESLVAEISRYRTHIPIVLNNNGTHAFYNGTVKLRVKNTGDSVLGLDSLYAAKAASVKYGNIYNLTSNEYVQLNYWDTIDSNPYLDPGEENIILADVSNLNLNVNEDLVIAISAISSTQPITAATDIGLIQTINDTQDIRIIENIDSYTTSYIMANESGVLLVKNVGNSAVKLTNIYLNTTASVDINNDVQFLSGDEDLGIQECALISFNIPILNINKSDSVIVNITTNTSAQYLKVFQALENPPTDPQYYNISINTSTAEYLGNIVINVKNNGKTMVTMDSIFNFNTSSYIPLNIFQLGSGQTYNIAAGGSISLTTLLSNLGMSITVGSKLKILARTKQGAEHEYTITVTS